MRTSMFGKPIVIALLGVLGIGLLLGFYGLKDAKALDETVTFWSNMTVNLGSNWFKILSSSIVLLGTGIVIASNAKKAIR